MRTFSFYMQDEHQPVTLHMSALLEDEARAEELARKHLDRSPHCLSVEVREGGRVLFTSFRNEPPQPAAA